MPTLSGETRAGRASLTQRHELRFGLRPRDEDRLEVLARAAAGAAVDVALEPLLEAQAGAVEDLRVEVAAVVDDDADRRARLQRAVFRVSSLTELPPRSATGESG